jgi:hypothetical protein
MDIWEILLVVIAVAVIIYVTLWAGLRIGQFWDDWPHR